MKWDIKMSIKENYKNSKLGLIPSEWEVIKLNMVCHKIMVGIASSATHAYSDEGIPMFRNQNIKEGGLDDSDLLYINESYERVHKNKRLKENDVLTIRTGYPGLSCVVPSKYENAQCFTSLIIRPIQDIINSNWLVYFINSPIGKKLMKSLEAGGAQKNINSGSLEKLTIPLIDIKEQQKIAKILSTWDEAIETTQSLIEKLQFRKKGLMQELLSGKKRLAGFSEEWEENNLGDYFTERKETGLEDLELLSVGKEGVYPQDNSNKKDTSNSNKSKYKRICKGDIGYNTMRMWQGRSALSNLEGIVSPAYTILNPKENCDSVFFSHLFKLDDMIHKFYRNSQGMVSDTWMCKFKDLKIIKFNAPSSLSEQKAISKIIDLSDIEISEKKAYLLQLKNQKKGLMQQLLTGKKRVKL